MMSILRVPYTEECCSLKRAAKRRTEAHLTGCRTNLALRKSLSTFLHEAVASTAVSSLRKIPSLRAFQQFQDVQRREGERRSAMDQVRLSLRRIRVCDVARNQKTAVSVMAGLQKGFSSRSRRTKFGNTRSPKIRFARASTSGHVTRLVCLERAAGDSSSKARIATITFSRSRAGNAFTRLISSATLIPLP